jgi:hypothetical protein
MKPDLYTRLGLLQAGHLWLARLKRAMTKVGDLNSAESSLLQRKKSLD